MKKKNTIKIKETQAVREPLAKKENIRNIPDETVIFEFNLMNGSKIIATPTYRPKLFGLYKVEIDLMPPDDAQAVAKRGANNVSSIIEKKLTITPQKTMILPICNSRSSHNEIIRIKGSIVPTLIIDIIEIPSDC